MRVVISNVARLSRGGRRSEVEGSVFRLGPLVNFSSRPGTVLKPLASPLECRTRQVRASQPPLVHGPCTWIDRFQTAPDKSPFANPDPCPPSCPVVATIV